MYTHHTLFLYTRTRTGVPQFGRAPLRPPSVSGAGGPVLYPQTYLPAQQPSDPSRWTRRWMGSHAARGKTIFPTARGQIAAVRQVRSADQIVP